MKKKKRNSFTYYSTKKIICTWPLKKYFTISLMILLTAVLNSCLDFTSEKNKILPVPAINQMYFGWCGAACVQMWANYQSLYPEQEDIADLIGWHGSDPYRIAQGITQFTSDTGYSRYYSSKQKDMAIASQVASISDRIPNIPIVLNGTHAVIMKGYRWSEYEDFRPLAEGIYFNDPNDGLSKYVSVGDWKYSWFTPMDGINCAVVHGAGYYSYEDQGREGLREFHERDGIIYGEDPEGGEDPPPIIV